MKHRTIKIPTLCLAVLSVAALLCACEKATAPTVSAPEASLSAPSEQVPDASAPANASELPEQSEQDPAPEVPAPTAPEAPEQSTAKEPAPAPTPAPTQGKQDAQETPAPAAQENDPPAAETSEPKWAPDISFSTVDMSGKTWTDKCFADSKLTMINLWAYWCGPCLSELPDLQKLSQNYAARGVRVLGLYESDEEAEDAVVVSKLGVKYPCLRYTAAFDPYMNAGYILPVTIFVDSDGKVQGSAYVGPRSYDQWASVIDELLK